MNIRDAIITGSFNIGADGKREPPNWEKYAIALEKVIENVTADMKPIIKKALAKGTGRATVTDDEVIQFYVNL